MFHHGGLAHEGKESISKLNYSHFRKIHASILLNSGTLTMHDLKYTIKKYIYINTGMPELYNGDPEYYSVWPISRKAEKFDIIIYLFFGMLKNMKILITLMK